MSSEKIRPGDLLRKKREAENKRKMVRDMLFQGIKKPFSGMEGDVSSLGTFMDDYANVKQQNKYDYSGATTDEILKMANTMTPPDPNAPTIPTTELAYAKAKKLAEETQRNKKLLEEANRRKNMSAEEQAGWNEELGITDKSRQLIRKQFNEQAPLEMRMKQVDDDLKRAYIKKMFFHENAILPEEIDKRMEKNPRLDVVKAGEEILQEREESNKKSITPGFTELFEDIKSGNSKTALKKVLKAGILNTRALGQGLLDIPASIVKSVTFMADPRFNLTKRVIDAGLNPIFDKLLPLGNDRRKRNEQSFTKVLDKSRDYLNKYLEEVGPDYRKYKQDYFTKMSTGAGSVIGFMLATALSRGMNITPEVAVGLSGLLSQAGSMADDTYRKTGDFDKAYLSFLAGIPLGYSERFGLGELMGNIDKLSGGSVKRVMIEALREGTEETLQEGFQSFGEAYSDNLITDAGRDPLKEALDGISIAAPLGFIFPFGVGPVTKIFQRMRKVTGGRTQVTGEEVKNEKSKGKNETQVEPVTGGKLQDEGEKQKPEQKPADDLTAEEIDGLKDAMDELGIGEMSNDKGQMPNVKVENENKSEPQVTSEQVAGKKTEPQRRKVAEVTSEKQDKNQKPVTTESTEKDVLTNKPLPAEQEGGTGKVEKPAVKEKKGKKKGGKVVTNDVAKTEEKPEFTAAEQDEIDQVEAFPEKTESDIQKKISFYEKFLTDDYLAGVKEYGQKELDKHIKTYQPKVDFLRAKLDAVKEQKTKPIKDLSDDDLKSEHKKLEDRLDEYDKKNVKLEKPAVKMPEKEFDRYLELHGEMINRGFVKVKGLDEQNETQGGVGQATTPTKAGKVKQTNAFGEVRISDITKKLKDYQGRQGEDYSEQTFNRIVNDVKAGTLVFDALPPIQLFERKNGDLELLAGHSRLAAFEYMNKEGIEYKGKDFSSIRSQIIRESDGVTYEQAKKIAQESNQGAVQKPTDNAVYLRGLREKGEISGDADQKQRAEDLYGKSGAQYVIDLSYLNPKGKTFQMLKSLGKSSDKDYQRRIESIASWIGGARKKFDDMISDKHENEMFDWLMDENNFNLAGNKTKFAQRVQDVIDKPGFDPRNPLNLPKRESLSNAELEYRRKVSKLESEIRDQEKLLKDRRKELSDRKLTDKSITNADINRVLEPIRTLILDMSDELTELKKQEGRIKAAGEAEIGLFGSVPEKRQVTAAVTDEKMNKVRDDIADLEEEIRKSMGDKLVSGYDPKLALLTGKLISKYIQLGYYKIEQVARQMVAAGMEKLLPYLKEAYNKLRQDDNLSASIKNELSDENEVRGFDTEGFAERLSEAERESILGDRELSAADRAKSGDRRPALRYANDQNLPDVKREYAVKGKYDIDEHQRYAVNLALQRYAEYGRAFLLADGPGVGKTREQLVIANEYKKVVKTGESLPILIITESDRVIKDSFTKDAAALNIGLSDFEIGTYGDLRDGKVGKQEKYGLVIYDEAHNLKNAETGKAKASRNINADNVLYATATPMDKPASALYFIGEIADAGEGEVAQLLGLKLEYQDDLFDGEGGQVVTLMPGVTEADVIQKIIDLRNKAISKGAMIRREYPFFGTVKNVESRMPDADFERQNTIFDKYKQKITSVARSRNLGEREKKEIMKKLGQKRASELHRLTESLKSDMIYGDALKEIENGKQVIFAAEYVNDSVIDSIGHTVESSLSQLKRKLEKNGIKYAELYGGNKVKNRKAMIRFQTGQVQALLMTYKSGGVGINLDDVEGDKPRVMFVLSPSHGGDMFQQVIGRVSRRNTQSPADVRLVYFEDSFNDNRRREIINNKMRTLNAIQEGADVDSYDAGNADIRFMKDIDSETSDVKRQTESEAFKKWFGDSKVVDADGKPLVVYSGHSNSVMWGNKYDPKKSTAGGFYATEDPKIASNYALGKLGIMESFENGSEYRLKGKSGEFNKKIWQYELTDKQLEKLQEMKKRVDEDGNPVFQGLWNMDSYIKEYMPYEKDVRRWAATGGSNNLQNIFEFNEQMGNNIAYDKQDKPGENTPAFLRQTKGEFDEILDELGIEWTSATWRQPGVYPLYLKIENPIDAEKPFPADLFKALQEKFKYSRNSKDNEFWHSTWTKDYNVKDWIRDIESGDEGWSTQIPKKALDVIKSFGYDGIREVGLKNSDLPRSERQINWIAFEPTQIKSATGNRGTFDPNNPDIRFKKDDEGYGNLFVVEKALKDEMTRLQRRLQNVDFELGTDSVYYKTEKRLGEIRQELTKVRADIAKLKPKETDFGEDQMSLFSKSKLQAREYDKEIGRAVLGRLGKTGLAGDVRLVTNDEMLKLQKKYGNNDAVGHNGFSLPESGEVVLNEDKLDAEAPIHEYGHLFGAMMRKEKRGLWNAGLKIIKQAPADLVEYVRTGYPGLKGDKFWDEVLMQAVGSDGKSLFNEQSAMSNENQKLFNRLKAWIKRFWDKVKSVLLDKYQGKGDRRLLAIEKLDMNTATFKDLSMAIASDLLSGNKVVFEKEVEEAYSDLGLVNAELAAGPTAYSKRPMGVNSPEFKAWFGDSKVVDADGKPLVVYHGTDADFTKFKRINPSKDIGMHFGTIGQATEIIKNIEGMDEEAVNQNIMPVYLSIQNPLRLNDLGAWNPLSVAQGIRKDMNINSLLRHDILELMQNQTLNQVQQNKGIREILQKYGYDGIVYKNTEELPGRADLRRDRWRKGITVKEQIKNRNKELKMMADKQSMQDSYIAFKPNQIKSATGNMGTYDPNNADIRYERGEYAEPFYSQLERVAESKVSNNATPEQVIKTLVNNGVKQEEIEWMGLGEWLSSEAGKSENQKISKSRLMDFIAQNKVQIEEKVLESGESKKFSSYRQELEGKYGKKLHIPVSEDYRKDLKSTLTSEEFKKYEDYYTGKNEPRNKQWQLPGGENPREILFTDPKTGYFNPEDTTHYGDIEGVIAWARINDRTTPDGKKMLFIEEVQSKLHQLGRKHGYGEKATAELKRKHSELLKKSEAIIKKADNLGFASTETALRMIIPPDVDNYDLSAEDKATIKEYLRLDAEMVGQILNGVPDAPFKKTWHELVMKRMIRYAAENGYDSVGWTTGEQQNERYDLSKQVDEVAYDSEKSKGKSEKSSYSIYVKPKGESGYKNLGEFEENKLADVVGKELAEKIIKGEGVENEDGLKSFTGVDLKIGGEGMKGFYDKMLPSFVNKYAKKWGGKVTGVKLHVPRKSSEIGGESDILVDIKDYLQDSVPDINKTDFWDAVHAAGLSNRQYDLIKKGIKINNYNLDNIKWDIVKQKLSLTDKELFTYIKSLSGNEITTLPDWKLKDLIQRYLYTKPAQETIHRLDITPEMANSVLYTGQAMFQKAKSKEQITDVITDKNGGAKVFYHGSRVKDIAEFKANNGGIYFTSRKDVAEDYARKSGGWMSPNLDKFAYEVYLKAENPLVIDAGGTRNDNIPVPWQEWKPKSFGNLPKNAVSISEAAKYAKENGYDALIVNNVIDTMDPQDRRKSDVAVVFDGGQVIKTDDKSGRQAVPPTGDVTQTEAFKKWFGDSKVVDSDGKPLVVYHGTNKNFNEFIRPLTSKKDKIAGKIKSPLGILGSYFTGSTDLATDFARYKWSNFDSPLKKGANIYPVYLSLQNPKEIDVNEMVQLSNRIDESLEQYRNYLIKAGYDGLIIKRPKLGEDFWASTYVMQEMPTDQYVAFYPEQIKSATGNRGTFDAGNPDIRFMKDPTPNPSPKGRGGETPSGLYVRKNKTISDKVFNNNLDKLGKIGAKILIDEKTKTPRGFASEKAKGKSEKENQKPEADKKTFKKTINEVFSNEGNKKPFVLSEDQADKLYEAAVRLVNKLERDKMNKEREFQKRTAKTIGARISRADEKSTAIINKILNWVQLKPVEDLYTRTIGKPAFDKVSSTLLKEKHIARIFEQFAGVPDRETFKKLWKEMEGQSREYKELAKDMANSLYWKDIKNKVAYTLVEQRLMEQMIRGNVGTPSPRQGGVLPLVKGESFITLKPSKENGLKEPLVVDMSDLKQRVKRAKELAIEMKKLGELYDVLPIETYNSKLSRKRIAWLLKFKTELEMLKATSPPSPLSKGEGEQTSPSVKQVLTAEWQDAKGNVSVLKFRNAAEIQDRIDSTDKMIKNNFKRGGEGYFKRVYVSKELEKTLSRYGIIKPTKLDLTSAIHRKDIPLDVRVKMGEVLTAAYPTAKSIVLEGKDISIGRFFEAISENAVWSSHQPVEGWEKVPDSNKYGKLRNMHVHPEVWKALNDVIKFSDPGYAENFVKQLTSIWKAVKVPMNPPTVSRNIINNFIMQDYSGTSWNESLTQLPKALKEMRNYARNGKNAGGGEYAHIVSEFKSTSFSAQEMLKFLDDYEKQGIDKPGFMDLSLPDKILKIVGKGTLVDTPIGTAALNFYQGSEVAFKMVKFLDGKAKGMTDEEAVNEANKWLFDYGDIPSWLKKYRESLFGGPFVTWSYKAFPRVIEAAVTRPISFWKYPAMFYWITSAAIRALGMTDDDWEQIKKDIPDRMKQGQWLLIPYRDGKGQIQMLDLTFIMPYQDIYTLGLTAYTLATEGTFPTGATIAEGLGNMLGNPLMSTTIELSTNYNRYNRREIWNAADKPAEKYQKMADYIYKMWMPSFAPETNILFRAGMGPASTLIPDNPWLNLSRGGYVWDKLRSAITGRPDYYGRVFDLGPAIGSSIFGLKTTPIDPDKLVDDNIKRREGDILDLQQKKGQVIKDDSIPMEQRLKQAGEIDDRINALKEEIKGYEKRQVPAGPEAVLLDRYIRSLQRDVGKKPELQAEINKLKIDLDILNQEKYNKDQPGLNDIKSRVLKNFKYDKVIPVIKAEMEKELEEKSEPGKIEKNRELMRYLKDNQNIPDKSRKEFEEMYNNYDKVISFKKDVNKINDVYKQVGLAQNDGKPYSYKPSDAEESGYSVEIDRAITLLEGGYMKSARYKDKETGKMKTRERRKVEGLMERLDKEYKDGKITADERKVKKDQIRDAVKKLKEMR